MAPADVAGLDREDLRFSKGEHALSVRPAKVPVRQPGQPARLVLLRSRLMLPASPVEAQRVEREAAEEELRWAQWLQMPAVVAWLEARPQLGRDVCGRPLRKEKGRTETTMVLMKACLAVLRGPNNRPEAAPVYRPVLVQLWRVEQALGRIRKMLAEDPEGGELAHFLPAAGQGPDRLRQARGALAGIFVVCLEFARQGEVEAEQDELFEAVRIRRAFCS